VGDFNSQPHSIAFTFPSKSPDGTTIKSGDHCTVSILDGRDWGACVDFEVKFPVNQVVGGVLTPVLLIGMGFAFFMARMRITNRLRGSAAVNGNDATKWRNINMALAMLTTLLAIIATAAPYWSTGTGFHVGPWLSCGDGASCQQTTNSGLPEFHLVRLFSLLPVFIGLACIAQPILVARNLGDPAKSAKYQAIAFAVMAGLSFTAFMIWVCVLNQGSKPGWALFIELANFVILVACTLASIVWYMILVPATGGGGGSTKPGVDL